MEASWRKTWVKGYARGRTHRPVPYKQRHSCVKQTGECRGTTSKAVTAKSGKQGGHRDGQGQSKELNFMLCTC